MCIALQILICEPGSSKLCFPKHASAENAEKQQQKKKNMENTVLSFAFKLIIFMSH